MYEFFVNILIMKIDRQKRGVMNEKSLVNEVCDELGITQKELADKIGANSGTVKNWSSKNEVPLWAKKSIELLIENHHKDKFIDNFKEMLSFLQNEPRKLIM